MTTTAPDAATEIEANKRREYIAGLRALAELLETHPELELPYDGSGTELLVIPTEDEAEQIAAWAKALPGMKRKQVRDGYFDLFGSIEGLRVQVIVGRDSVCRRVVVGIREVTEEIPDPSADIPTVTVTRTVEDVEWICEPILGERVAS